MNKWLRPHPAGGAVGGRWSGAIKEEGEEEEVQFDTKKKKKKFDFNVRGIDALSFSTFSTFSNFKRTWLKKKVNLPSLNSARSGKVFLGT